MPIPAGDSRAAWLPTVDQVHALIPLRPAFSGASRPSTAEVTSLIDQVADVVDAESDVDFPDECLGKVRFVIALEVASLIESAYWPEQQTGPDSPSEMLNSRYQGELLGLRSHLARDFDSGVA
jgi:hypothetical protein